MPTTNYRSNAGELIQDALYLIEALEEGEPLSAEQEAQGMRGLSRLIASWQAQSEHVWTMTEAQFALSGRQSYRMGRTTTDVIVGDSKGDITYNLGSPAPALTTSISVPSDAAVGDVIVGPTLQTITTKPATTTATITPGIPPSEDGSIAPYGDLTPVYRPLRVLGARRAATSTGVQIPLHKVSRETYMDQPNKAAGSTPVEFFYDAQLEYGDLFLWGTGDGWLFFTYERELLKPTATTDVLDFPEEWFDALIYNLANRLAPMYATNPVKRQLIKMEAEQLKSEVLAMDSDAPCLEISA